MSKSFSYPSLRAGVSRSAVQTSSEDRHEMSCGYDGVAWRGAPRRAENERTAYATSPDMVMRGCARGGAEGWVEGRAKQQLAG
jgi:hypothetical protein